MLPSPFFPILEIRLKQAFIVIILLKFISL